MFACRINIYVQRAVPRGCFLRLRSTSRCSVTLPLPRGCFVHNPHCHICAKRCAARLLFAPAEHIKGAASRCRCRCRRPQGMSFLRGCFVHNPHCHICAKRFAGGCLLRLRSTSRVQRHAAAAAAAARRACRFYAAVLSTTRIAIYVRSVLPAVAFYACGAHQGCSVTLPLPEDGLYSVSFTSSSCTFLFSARLSSALAATVDT